MLIAYAVARMLGRVTFARIVLLGPVLKNRKNTAAPIAPHAYGNGSFNISRMNGHDSRIATPETQKYAPGNRSLSLSLTHPPHIVAVNPLTSTTIPKTVFTCAKLPAARYLLM